MTERKRHPAQGGRIAAAGLGATTMLGLIGAMGYAQHDTSAATPAPASAGEPRVVVVVHPSGASDTSTPAEANAASDARAVTALKARPTVRPASPQAQAPAASTSGSR